MSASHVDGDDGAPVRGAGGYASKDRALRRGQVSLQAASVIVTASPASNEEYIETNVLELVGNVIFFFYYE